MSKNCQKSCNACPGTKDVDENGVLALTLRFGEQQDATGARMVETIQVVQDTIDYMLTDDFTKLEKKIQENCMNRNKLCSFW
jgi:hypothetical protein